MIGKARKGDYQDGKSMVVDMLGKVGNQNPDNISSVALAN